MNRREVLEDELDAYIDWRLKNIDYSESEAHLKYVDCLVGGGK